MKTGSRLLPALLIPLLLASCAAIETPDSPSSPAKKATPLQERLEMAAAYDNHGVAPQAILEYQEVLKLDPSNTKAVTRLAYLNSALKRYDEAETYYKKGLELEPGKPDFYNGLAWVYLKGRKDFAAAHEMVDKALAAGNERRLVYLETKGLIQMAEKKYDDAIKTFKASLAECDRSKLDADMLAMLRTELLKYIGRSYRALGNEEESRAYLLRALDSAPPGVKLED